MHRRPKLWIVAFAMAAGCHRAPGVDAYRKDAEKQLGDLERRLEELSAHSKNAQMKTRADAEHALAEIRNETDNLARRIDGLDSAATAKLDRAKEDMRREVDELKKKIDKARVNLW